MGGWDFFALHILAKVPVLDILHRQKYILRIFIPSKELDKQVTVLCSYISYINPECSETTYISKRDQRDQLMRKAHSHNILSLQLFHGAQLPSVLFLLEPDAAEAAGTEKSLAMPFGAAVLLGGKVPTGGGVYDEVATEFGLHFEVVEFRDWD